MDYINKEKLCAEKQSENKPCKIFCLITCKFFHSLITISSRADGALSKHDKYRIGSYLPLSASDTISACMKLSV